MTMDAVKREDGVSGWKALYTFIQRGGAEPSVSIRGNFQDAARDLFKGHPLGYQTIIPDASFAQITAAFQNNG